MTIDDLAVIIEKTVAKKEDLADLATKVDGLGDRMDGLGGRTDTIEGKIDALEQTMVEEFKGVRQEIKMLNFAVEIDDLRARMKKVEEKLGLSSAVSS